MKITTQSQKKVLQVLRTRGSTTINPIWHSHPVHPGTKNLTFVALKASKTSSLHAIFILETQTNQATCCLDFQSSIFFLSSGLDTLFFLQSILTLIV